MTAYVRKFSLTSLGVLTQVLHILVRQQLHGSSLRLGTRLEAGSIRLEDHYAVRSDCRDKRETVAELSPAGVVVEGDVRQTIASDSDEEGKVTDEPSLGHVSELQSELSKQLTNCRVVASLWRRSVRGRLVGGGGAIAAAWNCVGFAEWEVQSLLCLRMRQIYNQ
jgi:hypothetical protein